MDRMNDWMQQGPLTILGTLARNVISMVSLFFIFYKERSLRIFQLIIMLGGKDEWSPLMNVNNKSMSYSGWPCKPQTYATGWVLNALADHLSEGSAGVD